MSWKYLTSNFITDAKHQYDELQELHKLMENSFDEADFTNHKMGVVISGMEGIGKSQLVRQYWKIHQENFFSDHCIWINGHSEATMANDFRAIGELCDMPKNSDGAFTKQSEIVSWVYRHFAKREDNNSSTKKVGVFYHFNLFSRTFFRSYFRRSDLPENDY